MRFACWAEGRSSADGPCCWPVVGLDTPLVGAIISAECQCALCVVSALVMAREAAGGVESVVCEVCREHCWCAWPFCSRLAVPLCALEVPTYRPPQGNLHRRLYLQSPRRAVLDRFCVTCHNSSASYGRAPVGYSRRRSSRQVTLAVWEKVLHKLRAREMPPPGLPRPDNITYDSLANYIETALDQAAEARPNPGRPAVYRLNRFQYANAIRDVIALDIDTASLLPADDSGYGFDNIGDVLTVSPMLLEKYLSAAEKISRLAVGDPSLSPTSTEYQIPPGHRANRT